PVGARDEVPGVLQREVLALVLAVQVAALVLLVAPAAGHEIDALAAGVETGVVAVVADLRHRAARGGHPVQAGLGAVRRPQEAGAPGLLEDELPPVRAEPGRAVVAGLGGEPLRRAAVEFDAPDRRALVVIPRRVDDGAAVGGDSGLVG